MPERRLFELYSIFSNPERDHANDDALLAELAQIARGLQEADETADSWQSFVDDCLYEIAGAPVLFVAAISQWLTTNEDVALAQALLSRANVNYLSLTLPGSFDFTGIDVDRAVLTGFRLCAWAAAPALCLGWVLSLSRQFTDNSIVTGAVEFLLRYHREEFPSTTGQLLAAEGSEFRGLPCVQSTLAVLTHQEAELTALPLLREFIMTPEMRVLFSNLKRRENRDIQRMAQEGSIFGRLMTHHHLKYATRTAIEVISNDGVQETSLAMSSHEFSIELPISEVSDPVLGNIRRRLLWTGPRI